MSERWCPHPESEWWADGDGEHSWFRRRGPDNQDMLLWCDDEGAAQLNALEADLKALKEERDAADVRATNANTRNLQLQAQVVDLVRQVEALRTALDGIRNELRGQVIAPEARYMAIGREWVARIEAALQPKPDSAISETE